MIEPIITLGKKTVVAMVHLPALPGSPDYDPEVGMNKILDAVMSDLEALQSGGVDAVMFGNEFDRPYVLKAPHEGLAAIAAVIGAAGSYANTYKDDAEQMYYNDIANAAGNSGAAMEIAKILTSPAYNISDRSTGWTVRAGLSNNYMQAEGVEDSGDLSIGAEYACPMDLDKQLTVNFDYDMDLNEDGPTSMSLGASYSIDHSYNWATSAMFGYMSETDNINDVTRAKIKE